MEPRPIDAFPLQYATLVPDIVTALEQLPRTGWVQWEIPTPETVWQHTLATRSLANTYQTRLALDDEQLRDVLAIIEVHDWPEATVGDLVILGDEDDAATRTQTKHEAEREAMSAICAPLAVGGSIMELFERYESGADQNAQLAKELDKLQAVLLADQYEQTYQKPGLAIEFVTYTRSSITHPALVSALDEVAARYS